MAGLVDRQVSVPAQPKLRRTRRWWEQSSYVGAVALAFTVITVVNSGMMVAGWDTPKTGVFAYTHLLGRLAIVAAVVALFHLDNLHEHIERWRHREGRQRVPMTDRSRRGQVVDLLVRHIPPAPLERVAAAFTAVTAALCVVAIASSLWREPRGGVALYLALLLLAATLAVLVGAWSWVAPSRPAPPRHPGER